MLFCVNKFERLSEKGRWVDGEWEWEFIWRRNLLDRELDGVNIFMSLINRVQLRQGTLDKWCWKTDKEDKYCTRSAYKVLAEDRDVRSRRGFHNS